MNKVIVDPAMIFQRSFPASIRERILAEARAHLAPLLPKLAELTFSQLPDELKTLENKTAMDQAARETVQLKVYPIAALSDTIRILRAWIVKIELVDGPNPGASRVLVSCRKA